MLIHFSFPLVLLLSIIFKFFPSWLTALGVILLHECVHLFFSYLYKQKIKKIVLYGFGISIKLHNQAFYDNYIREIVICLSAPVFNILFAIILYYIGSEPALYLAKLSFLIGFVNLLPILPLDGGRAFRAFVCEKHGVSRGYKKSLLLSKIMLICLGIFSLHTVFFNFNLSIILIMAFLVTNIIFEEKQINLLKYKNTLYSKEKLKSYRFSKIITAKENLLAVKLLKEFSINKYNIICVTGKKNKLLTETDIYEGIEKNGVATRLNDIDK